MRCKQSFPYLNSCSSLLSCAVEEGVSPSEMKGYTMSQPEMIPYDPLLPDDRSAVTPPPIQYGYPGYPYPQHPVRPAEPAREFAPMSRTLRLVGCLIIVPIYMFILARVLHVSMDHIPFFANMDSINYSFWLNTLYDLILVCLTTTLMRKVLVHDFKDIRARGAGDYFASVGIGYALFFACNMICSVLTSTITGSISSQNQQGLQQMVGPHPIGLFILAVFIGPITEELIFRGIVFRTVRPIGIVPAVLVSSLLFGFIHVQQYVLAGDFHELLMILPYMGMGVALGLIYERRRNILINITVHMIQNAFAMIMMMLLHSVGFFN